MRKKLHRLLYLTTLLLCLPAQAEDLQLYSVEAPPLTSSVPGQHGLVGEVVTRALQAEQLPFERLTPPWSRAQLNVRSGKNLLIMPLSRIAEREAQYTWIAPIYFMQRAFFSLVSPPQSMQQARDTLNAIGVGLGSAQHALLLAEGFRPEQLRAINIGDSAALMLQKGRLDAWFNGIPESRFFWAKISQQPLQMSPPMSSSDLYLACSLDCDDELVVRLQKRLQLMYESGEVQRIQSKYSAYTHAADTAQLPATRTEPDITSLD
jgi:polar amino acid transport system substrate-binding protein